MGTINIVSCSNCSKNALYRNKETDNSRNGHSRKTMHTSYGDMDVAIPRDRNGDYEPQLIKKYQNTVTQDMEEKILSMYAKGMSTGDIESHMRELYDIDISDSTISRITDKILPIVKEWQERPLEEVYAVVFMDASPFHLITKIIKILNICMPCLFIIPIQYVLQIISILRHYPQHILVHAFLR